MKDKPLIQQVPHTKETIADFAASLVNETLNGDTGLLLARIKLKAAGEILKIVLKETEEAVMGEVLSMEKKSFYFEGVMICLTEKSVKYDYHICDDTQWNQLENEINRLKELKRFREKQLKARLETCERNSPDNENDLIAPIRVSMPGLRIVLPD